jgi:DNA-binding IclR family transcriptional regulator
MAATDKKPVGRKGDKIIRDALLAVQRNEPERLKRVAAAWWDAAESDQTARSALADRLDGKPLQPIAHSVAEETHDESSLDAAIRDIAGKVGLALSAKAKARTDDESGLPNIH